VGTTLAAAGQKLLAANIDRTGHEPDFL